MHVCYRAAAPAEQEDTGNKSERAGLTASPSFANALVQRVMVLDRGKIMADGPRDTVMQQLTRPKVA